MIQWCRPNFLGSEKDFLNKFEKPISEGQRPNASRGARRKSTNRLGVLSVMPEQCPHRRSQAILVQQPPPKRELVLQLHLAAWQQDCQRALTCKEANFKAHGTFGFFTTLKGIYNKPNHFRKSCEEVQSNVSKRFEAAREQAQQHQHPTRRSANATTTERSDHERCWVVDVHRLSKAYLYVASRE